MKRRSNIRPTICLIALAVSGCSLPSLNPNPQQQQTDQKVRNFTDNIDSALDQVDRERLKAAAERNRPGAPSTGVIASASTPGSIMATNSATAPAGETLTASKTSSDPTKPVPEVASPTPAPNQSSPLPAAQSPSTAVITPITPPTASETTAMAALSTSGDLQNILNTPPKPIPAAADPPLDDALALLRKRAAAHPTLDSVLAVAILEANEGHSPDAELLQALSPADRQVLSDLLTALQAMKQTTKAETLAERTAPIAGAADKWHADADLTLPHLLLASRVDSFGVYSAVEPKFQAGKRHTVILYCEVANFQSKKADDGWYETHLSQQETLMTEDKLLIWRPTAEDVDDRSQNQRHDFYLVKKLTIPETLAIGKYTLCMSVTDRTSNKIATMSLPIEIVK